MKKNSFFKDSFIFTLGNLLTKGILFLTLPLYTRILSTETFGNYNLYMSWVAIISIFIGLQLSNTLSIAKIKYGINYDNYVINAFILSNISFFIFFILSIIFKNILMELIHFNFNILLLIFINSYINFLIEFAINYFVQINKNWNNFFIGISLSLSNVLLSVSFIFLMNDDFIARILGQVLPGLLFSISLSCYFYKKINFSLRKINNFFSDIKFSIRISIPLIINFFGYDMLIQFDKIIVSKKMSVLDLAVYSFSSSLGVIINILFISIHTVWITYFFKFLKNNNTKIQIYVKSYILLGFLITFVYLTIFPEISFIFGGEQYKDSVNFIPIIILSYFFLFLYNIPTSIQLYKEKTKFIAIGTLFAAIINIVLNILLIDAMGLYGTSLARLISYVVWFLLSYYITIKFFRYNIVSFKVYFLFSIIITIYTILVIKLIYYIYIRYILLFLLLFIIYLFYIKYFKVYYNLLIGNNFVDSEI